jgi:hypothetical protein
MLELLFAFLEMFLEILFEAAFEFAAEFLGALVLRGVAEVFDTSEFKNPLLASVGYVFLRRSRRRTEPPFLSASFGSSLPSSRAQCGDQSCPCWAGNVVGGVYAAEEEQEGDANREFWLWLCICIRNGPRPFLFHQGNIGTSYMLGKRRSQTSEIRRERCRANGRFGDLSGARAKS